MYPSAHLDGFCRENLPPVESWPWLNQEFISKYPERLNASVELLDKTTAKFGGDRRAIIAAEGEFTYSQLLTKVCQVANLMKEKGIQPGNRVLLRGPNNASLAILWLAILRIGAVAVTTIPLQRAVELEKIVEIALVEYAFIDHRYMEEWELTTNLSAQSFIYGNGDGFIESAEEQPSMCEPCNTTGDDVSILAFTSGSTGMPKATMHFHRDILAIADTFSAEILKPNSDDIFAGTPPLAFTFGLGGSLIFPLRVGAATLLLEGATPPVLLEKIAEHHVTVLFTAPTAYRAMLKVGKPELAKSLRRCVSAGEHLPESTWHSWFEATGIKLIDGIGSTEMLHIFISASDDEIVPGMTGKPVPGFEAMIVDEDFHELPAREVGFLAVRGPTGCRCLNDKRQSVYSVNGWNVTGDLYLKDAAGYYKCLSRSDDMIISSGYNIAAPEVENALLTHPAVAEVAVVGESDEERGMLVVAYLVLNKEYQASPELIKELQDFVKAKIAPFKYPRKINFVDMLPKTTTGKLQRFRLKN
jgi:2-aminobenzoate-CoA ligase